MKSNKYKIASLIIYFLLGFLLSTFFIRNQSLMEENNIYKSIIEEQENIIELQNERINLFLSASPCSPNLIGEFRYARWTHMWSYDNPSHMLDKYDSNVTKLLEWEKRWIGNYDEYLAGCEID